MIELLRADGHRRMRWKNGGGETIEVAVSPSGASLEDFDWRVSMARVENDGPFSQFPGVDRTLAVLAGNGITLSGLPYGSVELTIATAPFAFDADVSASAVLIDGPILDLNVMSRHARFSHSLRRVGSQSDLRSFADTLLLLCGGGDAVLQAGESRYELRDGDTLRWGAGEPAPRILASEPGALYLAEFTRAG